MDFSSWHPSAALPAELLPYPPTELPVIRELTLPRVRHCDADQLVFIVVIETARTVTRQIAVQIIRVVGRRWQIDRD